MKLDLSPSGVSTRISLNGQGGEVILSATGIRAERTGIHARVAVLHGSVLLAGDTFNVGRNEEISRLAKSAHPGLPGAIQKTFTLPDLKHNLDLFCNGLWDCWSEREPAQELVTNIDDELIPPAWLLEPLVLEHQANLLYGERSATKSLTALILATTGLLQWEDNPFRVRPGGNYWETLYLDHERNEDICRYNLARLQRGMGLGALSVHYKRVFGPLARNIEWVRRYLKIHPRIRLVIVDSVTPAAGGNLNDSVPAQEMFEAERSLNTTTLFLAHASHKNPDQKWSNVIGHSSYETYAGNIWECRKVQEEQSVIADTCLYHRKSPAVYGLRKPIAYRTVFDEEHHSLTVSNIDPKSVAEFVERMDLKTRILRALANRQLTVKELAEDLGQNFGVISVTVSRLRANGAIVETGKDGKASVWGLAAHL